MRDMKLRIIVDQDEVLAQFVNKVLKRWNGINGTNFVRSQVNMWRMEHVLGVDTMGRSAEGLIDEWLAEDKFFEDLEPMEDAVWGFNELRKMGHDVVVATSIPEVAVHSYTGKRRWMRKHFPDFSMKNFIAVSRKGLLKGNYLIDDGSHNITDWLEAGHIGAMIFDAPWNQDIENKKWSPITCQRVRSWTDIVNFFGELRVEQNRGWDRMMKSANFLIDHRG